MGTLWFERQAPTKAFASSNARCSMYVQRNGVIEPVNADSWPIGIWIFAILSASQPSDPKKLKSRSLFVGVGHVKMALTLVRIHSYTVMVDYVPQHLQFFGQKINLIFPKVKFLLLQDINYQPDMLHVLFQGIGIDYDIIQVHVHKSSNIRRKYMVHYSLKGSGGITILLLHD